NAELVEARRAFPHLMNMVRASCLLYQRQRQKDEAGRLVATVEDYATARLYLAAPLLRLLGGSVSEPAARFLQRLKVWAKDYEFTTVEARKQETASRSAVSAWLVELSEAGLVELLEQGRGRQSSRWKLPNNPPDDAARVGIPELEAVFP